MPLDKLSDLAQQYLQEFQQLHGRPVIRQPPKQTIWKPPDVSTLKTNFDSAVFEELDAVGIGVIVLNSSGEVLAALFEIIPLPSSIVVLETIAAQRAVTFLQEPSLGSSIFEGDFETLILAIKNQCFHHPLVGHLIKDIIMSLASFLQYFSLTYIGKAQSDTCSRPMSGIFFSYFGLVEVCPSHSQVFYFRFFSNKIAWRVWPVSKLKKNLP